MLIRIVKYSRPGLWYRDLIGRLFTVIGSKRQGREDWYLTDRGGLMILKADTLEVKDQYYRQVTQTFDHEDNLIGTRVKYILKQHYKP